MATKKTKSSTPLSMDEVLVYLQKQSKPVTKRDVAKAFNVKGNDRIHLKKILKELKESSAIQGGTGGRKIALTDALPERVVTEVTGFDSMGELLARPLEWTSDKPMPQIIIVSDKLNPPVGIGDVVQMQVKPLGNNQYEGTTLRRVTAGENRMVGIYEDGAIYSVDRRLSKGFDLIRIPPSVKLKNKDIVLAEIPMVRQNNPKATFISKIGNFNESFAPTLIAIYQHSLPVAFTEATEKQVQHLTVPQVSQTHEDLKDIPFVTIDGADAKDFDDAVWAQETPDGFHVMIGIADVAWYVRSNTALDTDARLRGNSTYFPDRVLPMLPFELSNGVCSLNPNEPRAAMVCEVWLNKEGKKTKHKFKRAIIRSTRRLTYPEVQDALDGKRPIAGLEKEIATLHNVYQVLAKQRAKRGVLELDVPERQVVLNSQGKVTAIRLRDSLDSMKLIEELMILANVAAAETLEKAETPAMYRVHDRPSEEKLQRLNAFLTGLHYKLVSQEARPKDFNAILIKSEGTKQDYAINEMVLRSQSQAVYSPENIGHFGLALTHYAHFTSPIRRYADVLVHRALIKALKLGEGGLTNEEIKDFNDLAEHISATERQSAAAEMDAVDRYTASYLAGREGEVFVGRISSVTAFGLFVAIDEYGADGFIPFRMMTGDYYEYDDEHQQLMGRGSGKVYAIGEMIKVVLMECVPETGSLIFKPLTKKITLSTKKKAPKKKRK